MGRPRIAPEAKPLTVRLPVPLVEGLQQLFERDGIIPSESIRRAVQAWLVDRQIPITVKPKRGLKR
jgi:Arc/MetJ-type ribon-helix-helix transcriptional regulator